MVTMSLYQQEQDEGLGPSSQQENLYMGPWLVYTGDPSMMVLRLVWTDSTCSHKQIDYLTVTLCDENISAESIQMVPAAAEDYPDAGPDPKYAEVWDNEDQNGNGAIQHLLTAEFDNLQPDTEYDYCIQKDEALIFQGRFRTAPAIGDQSQEEEIIFFAYSDTQRVASVFNASKENNDSRATEIAIANAMEKRSFIIHGGDANGIGQCLDRKVVTGSVTYGWHQEYLHPDNDSSDSEWAPQGWLRASVPSLITVGNHDLKKDFFDTHYPPVCTKWFDFLYGCSMPDGQRQMMDLTGRTIKDVTYPDLPYWRNWDSHCNYVDWGPVRVIRLNTYACYDTSDAKALKGKIIDWAAGRREQKLFTVLVLHPPVYHTGDVNESDFGNGMFNTQEDKLEYLVPEDVRSNFQLVVSGHIHVNARLLREENGWECIYYVLGSGGCTDTGGSQDQLICDKVTEDECYGKFTARYGEDGSPKLLAQIVRTEDGSLFDECEITNKLTSRSLCISKLKCVKQPNDQLFGNDAVEMYFAYFSDISPTELYEPDLNGHSMATGDSWAMTLNVGYETSVTVNLRESDGGNPKDADQYGTIQVSLSPDGPVIFPTPILQPDEGEYIVELTDDDEYNFQVYIKLTENLA